MNNLLTTAQITRQAETVFVDKGNGTKVNYYIFPEFEIHANEVAAHTEQQWHHHTKIEEVLLINSGELTARWLDGTQKKEELLKPGDVIRVGSSVHTVANRTSTPVTFTVFRYVPDGTDKHELIKNDRYPDTIKEQT